MKCRETADLSFFTFDKIKSTVNAVVNNNTPASIKSFTDQLTSFVKNPVTKGIDYNTIGMVYNRFLFLVV
ncbi:MAG: hypothetical protein L0G16_05365, partial [Weeksellaceae bacterium]|nr:hypothetical protein [Weeksellaceae bacterium]